MLSNDPDKVESNFLLLHGAFPTYECQFSSLHRQCINLQQGRLRNEIHLHSISKGCFYVLKDFDQSQELQIIGKRSLQFYMFHT